MTSNAFKYFRPGPAFDRFDSGVLIIVYSSPNARFVFCKMEKHNDIVKQKRDKFVSRTNVDINNTSSSSSSSVVNINATSPIEIPESELENESENENTSQTDYDERIQAKESAIREVDAYIRKLQDRRQQLVADCNKLKDEKALQQSNKLARQNWESGKCGLCNIQQD